MELLHDSICLFKRNTPDKLLKELDSYFNDVQISEHQFEVNGSVETNSRINEYVNTNIVPHVLQYFLELNHSSRPDLNDYSWSYYLDREEYHRSGKMEHYIKRYSDIQVNHTCFRLVHRNNCTYDGNFIKYMGHMNNFTFLIGLSNDNEHDSNIKFPIQKIDVKLNRGDVLAFPAGLTHPYGINYIVNGKLKFIECMQ